MSSQRTHPSFKRPAHPPSSPPPPKTRKPSITARSLGLTKEQYNSLKSYPLRRSLHFYVKTMRSTPPSARHETALLWFRSLHPPLQAVLDIGVGLKKAFWQCHEVLRVIAESCKDVEECDIDMGEVNMNVGDVCVKGISVREVCEEIWIKLLNVMTEFVGRKDERGVDDVVLFRCIKDASDFDVRVKESEGNMTEWVGRGEWEALTSCLKKRKGKKMA